MKTIVNQLVISLTADQPVMPGGMFGRLFDPIVFSSIPFVIGLVKPETDVDWNGGGREGGLLTPGDQEPGTVRA